MANDIDKTSPHYKGEFGSIYEVNKKFPNGGVNGDYVEIDGWAHYWNADRGTWCVNAQRDSYWDELITNIIEHFKTIKGATYMGVATTDTVPDRTDAKMFYFALQDGRYTNFGNQDVAQGINVLLTMDGKSWTVQSLISVAQELGASTTMLMSQKAITDAINRKANTADVDTKFTEEKERVDAELDKKFDKESVAQESGDSAELVMSQKAVSDELNGLHKKTGYIARSGIYNIDDILFNNNYLKENDVIYIDFAPTVDSGAISFESADGKELFYITKEISKVVIPANFKQAKVLYGSIRLNKDVESLTNRIINDTMESFKSDISEQRLESINIGSNRGYYINKDGQKLISEGEYSPYYLSNKISIVEGEDIFVTASSNFGNAFYCIYGNNDEVIKKELSKSISDETSIENKKINVPKGSAYILIAWKSNSLSGKLSRLHTYTKDYLSICDNFTKAKVPFHFIVKSGKVLNADGEEYEPDPASDNFRISSHIPVTPGETIYVTGCAFWGQAIFSVFDASNNVVFKINSTSGTGTATKIFDKEVVVPANGSYCIVSWNLSDSMYGAVKMEKILPKSPFINKKWACIGDSWTDNRNANPEKRYFDFISEETGITPIMMGYSGSGYARLGQFSFYNRAKQLPEDTDVVTIFGSGNDLSSELPLGNITDNGTDTICGCINTTINNLLSVNPIIQIGIISPCPWKDYKDTQEKWDNYCKALEQIAKSRSIPYLDLIHCSGLRPWNDKARQLTYVDDNHTNQEGHKIFSSKIREFLKSILT